MHESYRSPLPLHTVGVEEDRSSLDNSGSSRLSYNSLTVEGNVHISETYQLKGILDFHLC